MLPWTSSFYLVPKVRIDNPKVLANNGTLARCPVQKIPTELFWYLWDTLSWIPVHSGTFDLLNGDLPIIDIKGARIAETIFTAWLDLFNCASENVVLSCGFVTTTSAGKSVQKPRKLRIAKSELLQILAKLRDFSRSVQNDEFIICFIDWGG